MDDDGPPAESDGYPSGDERTGEGDTDGSTADDGEYGGIEYAASDGSEDEPGAREVAREEREAMYPMTGYALVRVDYEEPPGEALTKVAHYGSLSSVDIPEDGPMTTYVVYDEDGNAYDRAAVDEASGR